MLRATLTLRCYANAPHCSRTLRMPHANCFLMFYLIFIHILVLSCLSLIIHYLQD
ncbi:MAG: hypothetical protein NZ455_06280 [Bacteroidia bacterium]|nr:hypothetical protein [Bacteroidia bacterium]MDW8346190.1 hypothetical protein [Bacteroidia bacterium]